MVKPSKEQLNQPTQFQERLVQEEWHGYAAIMATAFGGRVNYLAENGIVSDPQIINHPGLLQGYKVAWKTIDRDTQKEQRAGVLLFPSSAQIVIGATEIEGVKGVKPEGVDAVRIVARQNNERTTEIIMGGDGIRKYRTLYNPRGKLVSACEFSLQQGIFWHRDARGRKTEIAKVTGVNLSERDGQQVVIVEDEEITMGMVFGHLGLENIYKVPRVGEKAIAIYTSAFTKAAEDLLDSPQGKVS